MQPYTKEFACPYSSTDFLQISRNFHLIFFRKEEGFVGEKKFVNDTELFYLMRWLLRGVNICEIELTIYQRRVWVKRFYALHS